MLTQSQPLVQRCDAVELCFVLEGPDFVFVLGQVNLPRAKVVEHMTEQLRVPVDKYRAPFINQAVDAATQQRSEKSVRNPSQRLARSTEPEEKKNPIKSTIKRNQTIKHWQTSCHQHSN